MSKFYPLLYLVLLTVLWSPLCEGTAGKSNRANRITPLVQCIYQVMPSVVYLSTERLIPVTNEANMPFAAKDPVMFQAQYSLGSGCVIDEDGLILTNAHVIHRAERIQVTLNNAERYWAEVVAADNYNDLALLRILGLDHKLRPMVMAEPGDLLLGEDVVIVGNPYGLGGTIVTGVLSAVNRRISYNNLVVFDDLLQTDALVNPGHSGAPLLNINGELIGLSLANLQDAPGISFAIPQQRLGDALGQWLIPERFGNVLLGLVPGVKRTGDGKLVFYLQNVLPNSPAAAAGLGAGMVITHVNGHELNGSIMDISGNLWKASPGDNFVIAGEGGSYNITAVSVTPDDWRRLAQLKLDLEVRELTPEVAKALNYPEIGGVLVAKPPAGNNQVLRGDLLIQIGDMTINSGADLSRALNNMRLGQEVNAVFLEFTPEKVPLAFRRKNVVLAVNSIY